MAFLLTTNRADLLEPALATRPGRVNQAVEIALPDTACRERLIELYAADITLSSAQRTLLAQRLQGVSAAFIKELMRRAAMRAAMDNRTESIDDVTAALDELYRDTGALTRSLLGASRRPDPAELADQIVRMGATSPALTVPAEIIRQFNQ
ncbi:MAG: hypothetical protein ACKV2O_15215 [Acidimicrobiales bacterium]